MRRQGKEEAGILPAGATKPARPYTHLAKVGGMNAATSQGSLGKVLSLPWVPVFSLRLTGRGEARRMPCPSPASVWGRGTEEGMSDTVGPGEAAGFGGGQAGRPTLPYTCVHTCMHTHTRTHPQAPRFLAPFLPEHLLPWQAPHAWWAWVSGLEAWRSTPPSPPQQTLGSPGLFSPAVSCLPGKVTWGQAQERSLCLVYLPRPLGEETEPSRDPPN